MKTCLQLMLLACLYMSCTKPHTPIIGTYVSPHYRNVDKLLFAIKGSVATVGGSLDIRKDSTFTYTTCGNILTGIWSVQSDSIILSVYTNHWKEDSLAVHGFNGNYPSVPRQPLVFRIHNAYLEEETHARHEGKTIVNRLQKQ